MGERFLTYAYGGFPKNGEDSRENRPRNLYIILAEGSKFVEKLTFVDKTEEFGL